MEFLTVKLKDVCPNPYREIGKYKLQKARISALVDSINQTGFWTNVIGRVNSAGKVEIAYGHHRLEAAKQALGDNYKHSFPVADLSDYQMLQMMSSENSEDWGNTTEHDNLTVEQARDMLDEWFDSIREDDVDTMLKNYSGWCLHGIGYDQALEWFGGGDKDILKRELNRLYKHSPGRKVIANFIGMKVSGVQYALENIGMSGKEAQAAAEAADKAREKQREAEKAAREAKKIADKKQREAEEKRIAADLEAAEEEQAKADDALEAAGIYDRAAGEVFDKPVHAKAFRKAVTQHRAAEAIPVDEQVKLAKSIKKSLGEGGLSASAIESKVAAVVAKSQPASGLEAYESTINTLTGSLQSSGSMLRKLREMMERDGVTNMDGKQAEMLDRNLRATFSSIANFYAGFGMEPPTLARNERGSAFNWSHLPSNDRPYYDGIDFDFGEDAA